MKEKKSRKFGVVPLILIVAAAVAVGIFFLRRESARGAFAGRIAEMGPSGAPPETIEGLRSAIAAYEDRIERHVRDAAQTGIYWKILAVRLMDRRLYGEALEALEQAVRYFPEDPTLHYLTGLAASTVAKSTYDTGGSSGTAERDRLFAAAEAAHLRAIGLDGAYARPRYALGVLYVYELDRPEDALPHLRRFLELRSKDVDGMFVLAAAYYLTGAYREAVELYDRIIATSRDAAKRAEAESNKSSVLELLYE